MTDGVQIRSACKADADAISRILCEAFAEFANDYTPEAFRVVRPPPDEIRSRFDEGPIWLALNGAKPVGTVSVVPEEEWLYIRSMGVSPDAQGLGIGRSLLYAVESYAIENGFNKLFLYTTHFSSSAIRLYEKHGFIRGRDTAAEEWCGTAGLAMEKSIGRQRKINVTGS